MGHSRIQLPESAWLSLLKLSHLAFNSAFWVVIHAVCISTVHLQYIQAWVWRTLFCSVVCCWCRSHIWCRHGGQSSSNTSPSGLLTLYDHSRRSFFRVQFINLYFYLMWGYNGCYLCSGLWISIHRGHRGIYPVLLYHASWLWFQTMDFLIYSL